MQIDQIEQMLISVVIVQSELLLLLLSGVQCRIVVIIKYFS